MGFFSFIADAAAEANQDAHGHRLLNGVQSSFSLIPELDDHIKEALMMGYIQILRRLVNQSHQWTSAEKIKLGRLMQTQAQEKFDIDVAGSYAKWLAGAWLESGERTGAKAEQAHNLLTGLAASMLE